MNSANIVFYDSEFTVTDYDSALNVKCQDVVIAISDDITFIHFATSIS